jgi:hypothetical protein
MNPMSPRFEDEVRRAFRKGVAPEIAAEAAWGLVSLNVLPAQAFATACNWMRKWGNQPTWSQSGREYELLLASLGTSWANRNADPLSTWLQGAAWHAAIEIWGAPAKVQERVLEAYRPFLSGIQQHGHKFPAQLQADTFGLLARLSAQATQTAENQTHNAVCTSCRGVALTMAQDGPGRLEGLRLLQHQAARLEALAADESNSLRGMAASEQARTLHNIAQGRMDAPDGTKDDWRLALEEYRRVSKLPARRREPTELGLTYRAIGVTARQIAAFTSGPEREKYWAEAESAFAMAEQCLKKDPRGAALLGGLQHAQWNLRIVRMVAAVEAGRPQADLRELAAAAVRWAGTAQLPPTPSVEASLVHWRHLAQQHSGSELPTLQRLAKETRHQALSKEQAQLLVQCLATDLDVDEAVAVLIAGLVDAVSPIHSGLPAARRVWLMELRQLSQVWMQAHTAKAALPVWWLRWLEAALERFEVLAADPCTSLYERLHLSSAARELVELALAEGGVGTISAERRLRWFDRSSANAFRAEASLYGQSWALGDSPAAIWRRNLLRTRLEMDRLSFLVDAPALVRGDEGSDAGLPEPMLRAAEVQFREMNANRLAFRDDGAVQAAAPISDLREGLRRERAEMMRVLAAGAAVGFSATSQLPQRSDDVTTAHWLRARPGVGVFCVGLGAPCVVHADLDGQIREHRLAPDVANGEPDWFTNGSIEFIFSNDPVEIANGAAAWLRQMAPLGARVAEIATTCGLRVLVVRATHGSALLPWAAVPVNDVDTLGDLVSVVGLATLHLPSSPKATVPERQIWFFGCEPGSEPAVDFGRAAVRTGDEVFAGISRDELETAWSTATVVRIFTHGLHNPWYPRSSALQLRKRSGDPLDRHYSVEEVLCCDLRHCGRVELWACDSGAQHDYITPHTEADEPMGWSAAFRLAGARVVLSAHWVQPSWSTALLAWLLRRTLSPSAGGSDTAAALAAVTRKYREVMCPDGVVERAFHEALVQPGVTMADVLAKGWQAVTDEVPPESVSTATLSHLLGPVPSSAREATTEGALAILGQLRSPLAWAGWRVDVRDGGCL